MGDNSLMQRLRGWAERVRAFLVPPTRKQVSWVVGEESAPEPLKSRPVREALVGFIGFWTRVRTRVFRVFAGLLAVVDVALGVLLFSNVWYLNLFLYAFLVPNFLIMVHYLRLTRNS